MKSVDALTVKGINAGSEKAFSDLYHTYYTYLIAVCFFYCNDHEASRDVVSNVFADVWNRRQALTFPIHSYLMKAVKNGAIDYLRSRQSRLRVSRDYQEQFSISYRERYILSSPPPLQYIELKQAEKEIHEAIEKLPLRCRDIFIRHIFDGQSSGEIAESMGITVNTVHVQIKKAFDKLREQLKHLLSILILFTV